MSRRATVLMVDNFDSFTHNAVDLLEQLGARLEVRRHDAVDLDALTRTPPAGIVLSPGPGRPEDAGVCVPLIRALGPRVPILGICLGHQALAHALGGRIVRAQVPIHGRARPVQHQGEGLLRGLPRPFEAARYHSLVVDPRRPGRDLRPTAFSEEGEIMALRHRHWPAEGVQFHPESYLSPTGPRILAAFLRRCGIRPRAAHRVVR